MHFCCCSPPTTKAKNVVALLLRSPQRNPIFCLPETYFFWRNFFSERGDKASAILAIQKLLLRGRSLLCFLEDFQSHFSRSARLFCSWKMKSLTSEISLEKQRSIAAAAAGLYIFYHLKCIDMMSES